MEPVVSKIRRYMSDKGAMHDTRERDINAFVVEMSVLVSEEMLMSFSDDELGLLYSDWVRAINAGVDYLTRKDRLLRSWPKPAFAFTHPRGEDKKKENSETNVVSIGKLR